MANPLLPTIQSAIDAAVPFQREDAAFLVRHKRAVLGHKTGLGKTFISLLAWGHWPSVRRVLIVGTLSSIATWRRDIRKWGGGSTTILKGADPEWSKATSPSQEGIWLCTYATFRILMQSTAKKPGKKVPFDLLITDELHKALRNRTVTWDCFKALEFDHYIGATATWASKGPQDLFPVLHLIDRKMFPSFWRFVNTWCFVNDAAFGKEIFGSRNSEKLRDLLRSRYYRARTWREVGGQFRADNSQDPIVRRMEVIPMSEQQAMLYEQMQADMSVVLGDDFVVAQNSLDKLTKSLQLALSPKMLVKEADEGAAVAWVCERVAELPTAVVFVPFKQLTDICAEYLRANGYELPIFFLYGGISPDDCDATIEAWRKRGGVVFCTISYAQSFPLDNTDYAYMLGFDWDPNNNIQAEGRLRRFDTATSTPCLVTYVVVEGTEYYKVREVVNGKVVTVRQVLPEYGL